MKKIFLFLIGISISLSVNAQNASQYQFTPSPGVYSPLSGATAVTVTNSEDGYYNGIPIGFNFTFCGTVYTQINVSTDGWCTLGTSGIPNNITVSGNNNSFNSLYSSPTIAPLWDDNKLMWNNDISYVSASGTPGNRKTTVQWSNVFWNYGSGSPVLDFQVVFHENTNKIDYVYHRQSTSPHFASASIGIASSTGVFLSLNGSGPNPNASPIVNTTDISAWPAEGQVYAFSPCSQPSISGPPAVCAGSAGNVYSTALVSGHTYSWNIFGGTINSGLNTNSITVTWGTVGVGWVQVTESVPSISCSVTALQYQVTISALPVPGITGPASACESSTGNVYTTESGMTNYSWSVSAGGTIAAGGGTNDNTVTVTWIASGTRWVSVSYTNSVDCPAAAPYVYNLTVNSLPDPAGTISGTSVVCAGSSGVAYSVASIPNSTGYEWILPAGATIASGANTNTILVGFSLSAVSGVISVRGVNACGYGAASANFNVTVNQVPPAPLITNTGYILHSSAPAGNQWYFSSSLGGSGSLIPGATEQDYDASQTGTGYYWSIVSLNGCSSVPSERKFIVVTGIDPQAAWDFIIYPVPSNGLLNVCFSGIAKGKYYISIFNSLGMNIWTEANVEVNVRTCNVIDLSQFPNGIYTVVARQNMNLFVKKIIISK